MYQFKETTTGFFWINRDLIKNHWSKLSRPAKAVYPILMMYANKYGVAYPSEETLSILAGQSKRSTVRGIKSLRRFPGIESIDKFRTKNNAQANIYQLIIPQRRQRANFIFMREIIESGIWHHLTPTAKALYITIRSFSYAGNDYYEDDESHSFKDRMYDVCTTSPKDLMRCAGVTNKSYYNALRCLKAERLIEIDERNMIKVYIRIRHTYNTEYLNGVAERMCNIGTNHV